MKDMNGDEFPEPDQYDQELIVGLEACPANGDNSPVLLRIGYMNGHGYDALLAVQLFVEHNQLDAFVEPMLREGDKSMLEAFAALERKRRPNDN